MKRGLFSSFSEVGRERGVKGRGLGGQLIDLGEVSGSILIDFTKGHFHRVKLVGNVTSFSFIAPREIETALAVAIEQDSTGSRTISGYESRIVWANNSAPVLSTTASAADSLIFMWFGIARSASDAVGGYLRGSFWKGT